MALLRGTSRNDTLIGTSRRDIFYAGSGDDSIRKLDGYSATIFAGDGDNDIESLAGFNTIRTGDGNNRIVVQGTVNYIDTGSGNDTLTSLSGVTFAMLGAGDDHVILSTPGRSTYLLGEGDDLVEISGRAVLDNNGSTIVGGLGEDRLEITFTLEDALDPSVFDLLYGPEAFPYINQNGYSQYGPNFNFREFEEVEIIAPVLAQDDTYSLAEDSASITLSVLDNDEDLLALDKSALRITSFDPIGIPAGASLVLYADQTFSFDPGTAFAQLSPGEETTVSFSYYLVDDQGYFDTATVTLTVTGVANGPLISDGSAEISEDGESSLLDLSSLSEVSGLAFEILEEPTAGTASLSGTLLTFSPAGAFDYLALGESAEANITVQATTPEGETGTALLTFTIAGENDAPVFDEDPAPVAEPFLALAAVAAADVIEAPIEAPTSEPHLVSGAFTFADPDLSDTHVASNAALGEGYRGSFSTGLPTSTTSSATGALDWQFSVDDSALDDLAMGETLVQSYEITLEDPYGASDTAQVDITLQGANDAPVFEDFSIETIDDAQNPVDLSTLASDVDSDDDGTTLSYSVVHPDGVLTDPLPGTIWEFDSGGRYEDLPVGETVELIYTLRATDRHGASDDAQVLVTIIGDAPLPLLTDGVFETSEDASDAAFDLNALTERDDLTFAIDAGPALGTASLSGDILSFTPAGAFDHLAAGESAEETITIRATAPGGATETATLAVTITGENDAPTLDDLTIASPITFPASVDLAAYGDDVDSDDDGSSLTYAVLDAPGLPAPEISGTILTFDPGESYADLPLGETVELFYTLTATDSHGASTEAVLKVPIVGTAVADTPPTILPVGTPAPSITAASGFEDGPVLVASAHNAGQFSENLLAVLPDGRIAVSTFDQVYEEPQTRDNYLHVFSADGTRIAETSFVFDNYPTDGLSPDRTPADILALENGSIMALWGAEDFSGDREHIAMVRMQMFNGDGSPASEEKVLFGDGTGQQHISNRPTMMHAASIGDTGNVAIAYNTLQEENGPYFNNYDNRIALVSAAGNVYHTIALEVGSSSASTDTKLLDVGGGAFAAIWSEAALEGGVTGYVQIFDDSGAALTGKQPLSQDLAGPYDFAQLAGGEFIFLKSDYRGITAEFLDAEGRSQGPAVPITPQDGFSTRADPAVTALDDGGFVVAWNSGGATSTAYLQRFDQHGTPVGERFQVDPPGSAVNAYDVEIDVSPSGTVTVLWEESSATEGQDFYVQSFELSGLEAASNTGAVYEAVDGSAGEGVSFHRASGQLFYADPDAGDVHSVEAALVSGSSLGSLSASLPSESPGTITWAYGVSDADLDGLAEGEVQEAVYAVTITDQQGNTDSELVTVTLTGRNDAPEALPSAFYAITVDASLTAELVATDPDGDTLVFSLASAAENGAVNITEAGIFTYVPNPGYSGEDSFLFDVTDGSLTTTAEVTIDVGLII